MIQGPELPLLSNWQNFFMIAGTAAATLTGLMFVAITLIAGIEQRESTLNAGISAFNTPTVAHFGAVLLMAAMLSAPWPTFLSIALLLGLFGLSGMLYLVIVMRRMRRVPNYQPPLKDWLWYVAFPLGTYSVIMVAALVLVSNPTLALYIISAAMLVLLFLGFHNAWDLVIFFIVMRSRPENKSKE